MIREWLRRRRVGRQAPVETEDRPVVAPGRPDPASVTGEAGPADTRGEIPPESDPRLEVYMGQIADLPEHDRGIIIGVLREMLDEEAAHERQIVGE
jgi:hypothetical protein